MLKRIGTSMVLVAAIAGAGAMFVAKAAPETSRPQPAGKVALFRPSGDKPFSAVCKSGEVSDSRPDPKWVGESFAGDNCSAPRTPAPVDGFTASREQVVAGMASAERYSAASDVFQRCVQDFVAARKAQASRNKMSMDMSLVYIENHRVIASEKNKKKVSEQAKMAIVAFNEYGSGCAE